MPEFPELSEFGPLQRSLTPEEFMEIDDCLAKLYAEDAERLRKRLDEDSPDI